MDLQVQQIVNKLAQLTPDRLSEAVDFIDFLHQRQTKAEQSLTKDFSAASEKAFSDVWDNEEDAIYDEL